MSATKLRLLGPLALTVVLLASVFAPRPANPGPWLGTLFEWLHVPVFGLISLSLLALSPKAWRTWQRFALAFVAALFLGVLTEAVQIPMRRDASWEDIIADATGAASFLLAAFSRGRKPFIAILSLVGAFGLLISSAWPVILVTQATIHRNSQFPIIFGGDIESESTFVSTGGTVSATQWDAFLGRSYTRVELLRGRSLGIEIRGLVADWTGFSVLRLDMSVDGEQSLEITVRVHDKFHRRGTQPHNDRFNQNFVIGPGRTTIDIPIEDVKGAPLGRTTDMTDIDALVIYSGKVDEAIVFRLYEIRLD